MANDFFTLTKSISAGLTAINHRAKSHFVSGSKKVKTAINAERYNFMQPKYSANSGLHIFRTNKMMSFRLGWRSINVIPDASFC